MKALLIALAFVSFGAAADSFRLDSEYLNRCGGRIQLRGSGLDQLHLDIQSTNCTYVRVLSSRGWEIKGYPINWNKNLTLSNEMKSALSADGVLQVELSNGYTSDVVSVFLDRAPLGYIASNTIPSGWSYQFVWGSCELVDSWGSTRQAMTDDVCYRGSQNLPQGWAYGWSTDSWDSNCYLWEDDWNKITTVEAFYCR